LKKFCCKKRIGIEEFEISDVLRFLNINPVVAEHKLQTLTINGSFSRVTAGLMSASGQNFQLHYITTFKYTSGSQLAFSLF
jgi:hypothetical protein